MKLIIISILILLASLFFTKKETYSNNCPAAVTVNCPDKNKICPALNCPEPVCPELKCPGPNFPDLNCPKLTCPETPCPKLTCPEKECPEKECPPLVCEDKICPPPTVCPEPKWPERKCPEPSNLTESSPSLVPDKNTCSDIKMDEPESIKTLNKNFENFDESYRSIGSEEKSKGFSSGSYITITLIINTINGIINSDEDILEYLKNNGICNMKPFFNEQEINYINTFIDKIIKPLRKDANFKSILKKISDATLQNTKRVCSSSNITCNF